MKRYELRFNNEPTNLKIGMETRKPMKVRVALYNPEKPHTFYLDRYSNVNGSEEIEIKLPQSCEKGVLVVQGIGVKDDNQIRLTKLEKKSLNQYPRCYNANKKTLEFIEFAQWISENAGVLKTGRYFSKNKTFRIDYLPVIIDERNGKALTTPARISNTDGRIELSKRSFIVNTVPMRMAILLHEFSHFNLNVVQSDEIEADLNALKIYLALGYPIIEAHKAFLHVFKKTATPQNKERYEYLKRFIDNFDNLKYRICMI